MIGAPQLADKNLARLLLTEQPLSRRAGEVRRMALLTMLRGQFGDDLNRTGATPTASVAVGKPVYDTPGDFLTPQADLLPDARLVSPMDRLHRTPPTPLLPPEHD